MKQQNLQADLNCSAPQVGKKTFLVPLKWLLFSLLVPNVNWHHHVVYQYVEHKESNPKHFSYRPVKLWDVIFKNSLSLLINNWKLNSALFGFKFLIINIRGNTVIPGLSDNLILQ